MQDADQLKTMLSNTAEYAFTPTFLGFERNSGYLISDVGYDMPSQTVIGTYSDKNKVAEDYANCAKEMAELGFNVNLGLNAELGSAGDSITVGSFGSEAVAVSESVAMAVKGQLAHKVSTSVGTFSPSSQDDETAMYDVYKAGIDEGADFLMISHGMYTVSEGEDVPCSMSNDVVGGIVRDKLGFGGIVITAPMRELLYREEYAPGEAEVECIKAGVDMFLDPIDLSETVEYINEAVRTGELDVELINDSVKRILRVKLKRGLIN